jgi:hypothetical protein
MSSAAPLTKNIIKSMTFRRFYAIAAPVAPILRNMVIIGAASLIAKISPAKSNDRRL